MPNHRKEEKTRPKDNEHCFRGLGRQFWRDKALGFRPSIVNGRDGYHIEYDTESKVLGPDVPNADDFAYQNGGIARPDETAMRPGTYLRFCDSRRKYWVGNWWLDYDHFSLIRAWAIERDLSLAAAAHRCLVIPTEWGDCGRLVKAGLNRRLRAYVGKGKPATATVSPHNAQRTASQPVVLSPAELEIKQWFVPGEPALLSRFFGLEGSLDAFRETGFPRS